MMRIEVRVKGGRGPIEEKDGTLIIHTAEKRKNNKANIDVIKQLARFYSVSSTDIRIISGATSTKKLVEIASYKK